MTLGPAVSFTSTRPSTAFGAQPTDGSPNRTAELPVEADRPGQDRPADRDELGPAAADGTDDPGSRRPAARHRAAPSSVRRSSLRRRQVTPLATLSGTDVSTGDDPRALDADLDVGRDGHRLGVRIVGGVHERVGVRARRGAGVDGDVVADRDRLERRRPRSRGRSCRRPRGRARVAGVQERRGLVAEDVLDADRSPSPAGRRGSRTRTSPLAGVVGHDVVDPGLERRRPTVRRCRRSVNSNGSSHWITAAPRTGRRASRIPRPSATDSSEVGPQRRDDAVGRGRVGDLLRHPRLRRRSRRSP